MKKRKNYIFTNKRHSERSIMSTILGVISLLSLGAVIFLSYRNHGVAETRFGFTGILALVFSTVGIVMGILSWRDKNCYRLFPVLGTLLNLLALFSISIILYAGANL